MVDRITFDKNIVIGTTAEDKVYNYLIGHNQYVDDLRSSNRDKNRGPKLKGLGGELIKPDFCVYNRNNSKKSNYAVDVKYKTRVYEEFGKFCFTVDDKLDDYNAVADVLGLDFAAIIFVFENNMYFYKTDEYFETKVYKNEYNTSGELTYLFEFDKTKRVK